MVPSNTANLTQARIAKNDEFFTRYEDILAEVPQYKDQFEGKIVLCNTDYPRTSNFPKFFKRNFNKLKLRGLISTFLGNNAYAGIAANPYVELYTPMETKTHKVQTGDFRDTEIVYYLEKSDVVVTNPPFSLFKEFIEQLRQYQKDYLLIGSKSAITYKDVFPLLQNNEMWIGYTYPKIFIQPNQAEKGFGHIVWFTNIDTTKRHVPIPLTEVYDPSKYPIYDNLDAIEVSKTKLIPLDYRDWMGVPISYFTRHCPDQFNIIGLDKQLSRDKQRGTIKGKQKYARVILQVMH